MNWADLNPDLLRQVAKKVRDVSDFIRLHAVCKSWRSAVHLSDMPQQLPCFINMKWKDDTHFDIRFHETFTEREHTVPVNNISLEKKRTIMNGSLNGFILLKSTNYSEPWMLLNPLTGFHVALPFSKERDIYGCPIYFGPRYCPRKYPSKSSTIDVVFVNRGAEYYDQDKVCLWRYDDLQWSKITEVSIDNERITYCNGILCVGLTGNKHIRVIDTDTGNIVTLSHAFSSWKWMYLVEAGGDMLFVLCDFKHAAGYQFEVYQLEDNVGANLRLRKLKSIGNWVLFVDYSFKSLCLEASHCEGYQSNCIYFKTFLKTDNKAYCSIVKYEIEMKKSSTELIDLSTHPRRLKWFVPSLF